MNFWQEIARPIVGLSPMDGITDASFRFITARHGGPDVTMTEFVNVETAFFAPRVLIKDLTYSEIERPVVAQIYGHTPETFYKVAHVVCELGFDGLDINMGCPARKVVGKGSGAALIHNPGLARSIIRAAREGIQHSAEGQTLRDVGIRPELVEMIRSSNRLRTRLGTPPARRLIPVSVKTRLGVDRIVVEEWIRTLLEERPSVISLHGRTLKQMYSGDADWEAIGRAVALSRDSGTLILGNGDLQDMEDVHRRVRESNVDGVLLGRSTRGNPWIFRAKEQVKRARRSEVVARLHAPGVTLEERWRAILEHSAHFERHWGSARFVGMRKHLAWYCKASHRAAELRSQMVRVSNVGEVVECLRNYARLYGSTLEAGPTDAWVHGTTRRPQPADPVTL